MASVIVVDCQVYALVRLAAMLPLVLPVHDETNVQSPGGKLTRYVLAGEVPFAPPQASG